MTGPRRRISRHPESGCSYFLVDTCFLTNKYLRLKWIADQQEQEDVRRCHAWWAEIDEMVDDDRAMVYVPDLCIAESFKVLAKKYYDKTLKNVAAKEARDRLRKDVQLPANEARKQTRRVMYHDVTTNRDVIIGVDRFFEKAHKVVPSVGIVDLILLAHGKHLMDFYGFSRKDLFLVTIDARLYKLAKKFSDVPLAFNPLFAADSTDKVFV